MQFAAMFIGGLKAVGSLVSGAEESQNLKEVQRANNLSAAYARQDAQNELRIATADAEAQRRRGRKVVAEQATALAQSGLGDPSGMLIGQSAAEAELDALNIQYRGELRKRAGDIEADNYLAQADAARRARKTVPIKTIIGAGTNLLSGYASRTGAKVA